MGPEKNLPNDVTVVRSNGKLFRILTYHCDKYKFAENLGVEAKFSLLYHPPINGGEERYAGVYPGHVAPVEAVKHVLRCGKVMFRRMQDRDVPIKLYTKDGPRVVLRRQGGEADNT